MGIFGAWVAVLQSLIFCPLKGRTEIASSRQLLLVDPVVDCDQEDQAAEVGLASQEAESRAAVCLRLAKKIRLIVYRNVGYLHYCR